MIFGKNTQNITRENPCSRGRVVPCGQTDLVKLRADFRNFAKAPKLPLIGLLTW